ncbi:transketolase, putative [Perkinsus marinus ATCC 50983]|uniref:Transketolase n=1 Tax=Perkinsus marinus (strain ATCC 50983 / TXsc) TaxID=423536 RepID=C5K7F3_PERM5|nr:transketolase, putative [Perkinsus marinus ATCC 50983]EER19488.1 transketolase, putative [Perkinsus marinus ATCC 50983]|eukprot:XP_002787692.1 transketolase, putative [Perkinsus marinus ATCC 50983]
MAISTEPANKKVKVMSGQVDDQLAIDTIRTIAADMVQKAKSGHPGAPMGCAPMGHALYTHVMRYNAANPHWWNRDRFVLSNGHACALQYVLMHLAGYKDVGLEDLKNFRQLGSRTAGHPERDLLEGVEVSTGPLGQGICNAVGLAIAGAHLAATYNQDGYELFSNYTYVICGDGCLEEGVSSEACALAGHLGLGHLIVLYDDNKITIDGSTDLAFTEDVSKRFEGMHWQVLEVARGDSDVADIIAKVEEAKKCTDKPTIIKVHTTIGYGSAKQGTAKVHGAPLGDEDLASVKKKFGFDPEKFFEIPTEVRSLYKDALARGQQANKEWDALFVEYGKAFPREHAELTRRAKGALPHELESFLPKYQPGDKAKATRVTSGEVLAALMEHLPEVVGGSADLTASNMTNMGNVPIMQKDAMQNRYIEFGVREHGMAAILNGMHAYGGFLPFGATFVNFIGYCWGAMRLSCLSEQQVLYVMTHDSIDLGEDGPTHQPIEVLPLLRATPNMNTIRPCDGRETVGAYKSYLANRTGPTTLILSRSGLPTFEHSSVEGTMKGAYVIDDFTGKGDGKVIIIASGTEVLQAVEAKKLLSQEGEVDVRVVSMPSWNLFERQSDEYKKSVFPQGVKRLMVEASSPLGFERYAEGWIAMDTFGASGPASKVKAQFGFTADNIYIKAKRLAASSS